ncbi:MAG: OB-fold domain-containing protein [Gemmatimonadota bacterium]|nr:OB-fold domain-containing protein [Gemmatimonadota bacterium]
MKLDGSQPYFGEGMPLPSVDTFTRPFWEACVAHRLMIQRCAECGTHRSPPKPVCWQCQSSEYVWSESTGRGSVFSYTIVHHSPHPIARDRIPYNIAVVELEDCEHVLITSNVVDCPDPELRVGLPVEITWEERSDGQPLFRFRPAAEATSKR